MVCAHRENRRWVKYLLAFLALWFTACATVPYTERKSLHLVSDEEMRVLSFQQYSALIKKARFSANIRDTEMVKRVGVRIAAAAEEFMKDAARGEDIRNYRWEFSLIDDAKTANAWCMPGGKIAVYTGLLPITKDETGLAVVIGHEVAHAIARHANERMSNAMLVQFGGIGLSLALAQRPAATQDLFLSLYGISSNIGIMLPYSRLHEAEADRIGLMLMARAGYDPREAVHLWERMSRQSGARSPEILSTHPAPESRIANIRSLIPEVMPYYRKTR